MITVSSSSNYKRMVWQKLTSPSVYQGYQVVLTGVPSLLMAYLLHVTGTVPSVSPLHIMIQIHWVLYPQLTA